MGPYLEVVYDGVLIGLVAHSTGPWGSGSSSDFFSSSCNSKAPKGNQVAVSGSSVAGNCQQPLLITKPPLGSWEARSAASEI